MLCRFFVGLGSGVGLCVGPIYLAEISPSKISGNVGEFQVPFLANYFVNLIIKGVLTQLGIVLGIMITQAMGLRLALPTTWRIVLFFSFALSVAQIIFSIFVVESPAWLGGNGRLDEKKAASRRLWGSNRDYPMIFIQSPSKSKCLLVPIDRNEDDPLLDEIEVGRGDARVRVITVPQLLAARELRKPLGIICLAMASQQLSGKSLRSQCHARIQRQLFFFFFFFWITRHQRRSVCLLDSDVFETDSFTSSLLQQQYTLQVSS
jgi:MFS family permease